MGDIDVPYVVVSTSLDIYLSGFDDASRIGSGELSK